MTKMVPGSFRALAPRVPTAVALVMMLTGCLVLVGWAGDIDLLKRLIPGRVAMNPLTALTFMMAGGSLWLCAGRQTARRQGPSHMLGLMVMVVGFFRLMGYVLDWQFGPDQWLFTDKLALEVEPFPNRMSPNTAVNFVFVGCGLLLMDRTTRGGRRPTEVFALLVDFISLLALLGYVYQVSWLYGFVAFIPMALPTALVFHLSALGMFCARRESGWMALIMSSSPGGALVRRLFPVLLPGLVMLGWLRLEGEQRGLFDAETGTTLYTIVTICTVSGLIWWSARSLHRSDTARRQVQEELERFFTVSQDMLCIAGKDGYFKRINPAFSRTLGYTTEELLSRPFAEFVHPEDLARTQVEADDISEGQTSDHFENRYRCKDGSWRWLWWKGQLSEVEGLIYATARDITEQKLAQGEIQALNQTLNERATQLDASNQELEAFCYSVSHDLRAPLRGISGFAQALEEHAGSSLDDTGRGYLARVRNASDRMGQLIDDLLKLSRLTRAEMHLEDVDLSVQAEAVLTQISQRDLQRQVEWSVAPGITVHGDVALLRVLLENLLENAWKFTSKNPQAKIEVGMIGEEKDAKICFVRDNGVGFDMRYASKLFGAFQRLHAMSEFPGTGIGLATVQRVIRRHGGKVWAEAVVNGGSTFYFVL